MQVNIIKVGNSKGLRLPKSIIEEYNIEQSVELKLRDGYIELRPSKTPRQDWKQQFIEIANDPNEEVCIPDVFEDEEL